jgi:60 kDa SS-A/Ro ribonucleoprotein
MINTRQTPQSERADPRQMRNNAGGFSFTLTPLQRLRRFLVLGTDGGTYYVNERELTRDIAQVVVQLAKTEPRTLVDEIVQVSLGGNAPRQSATIFALAIAASVPEKPEDRAYALSRLRDVARTSTHFFMFLKYVGQFRGMGRALKRAVGNWYLTQPVDRLAYQVVKYRNREGWTHRDALRVAHPYPVDDEAKRALFDWITHPDRVTFSRESILAARTPLIEGFTAAQNASSAELPGIVRKYKLTWEMLPDHALNEPDVWRALLDVGVPMTALVRQLPRLTKLGLLDPLRRDSRLTQVTEQLTDAERLRQARVHPLRMLLAHRTYASGQGVEGKMKWTPVAQVVDALDLGFTRSFGAVEPTGKRLMLALDVSGSMSGNRIARTNVSARDASAAMALVTAATERDYVIVGFTATGGRWSNDSALTPLSISPSQRLGDAIRVVSGLPFGGTDCALPMIYAMEQQLEVDTFVIYTDNETWAGRIHPHQALRQYRERVNPQARLVVVGMTSTGFSIADPSDPGQLDVVGFDTSTPQLISDFTRGVL